jgi:alkylhydroperoxidase family enzyme
MRIAPLTEPFDAGTGELLAAMMPAGVAPIALFRTLAKNHGLVSTMHQGQGSYLLSRRFTVDMRIREIVIDRVCARCRCEYEFGVHAAYFADRVGLSREQLRSLVWGHADDHCWTDARERAIIRFVDSLHDTDDVDDELWRELGTYFTEEQLLDLLVLAGWYHAISFVARAARVPLEDWAPTFESVR